MSTRWATVVVFDGLAALQCPSRHILSCPAWHGRLAKAFSRGSRLLLGARSAFAPALIDESFRHLPELEVRPLRRSPEDVERLGVGDVRARHACPTRLTTALR